MAATIESERWPIKLGKTMSSTLARWRFVVYLPRATRPVIYVISLRLHPARSQFLQVKVTPFSRRIKSKFIVRKFSRRHAVLRRLWTILRGHRTANVLGFGREIVRVTRWLFSVLWSWIFVAKFSVWPTRWTEQRIHYEKDPMVERAALQKSTNRKSFHFRFREMHSPD